MSPAVKRSLHTGRKEGIQFCQNMVQMELCEENPKCLRQRSKVTGLVTSASSKHELFLECGFVLLPGEVERSEFTSD